MKTLPFISLSVLLLRSTGFSADLAEKEIDYSGIAEMYQEDSEEFVIQYDSINKPSAGKEKFTKQQLNKKHTNEYKRLWARVNRLKEVNSPMVTYAKPFLRKWLLEVDERKQRIYEMAIVKLYEASMSALGLE